MGVSGFSGLFFFQEETNWGDMPPFFPLQAPRWGVIQRSTPDQMVSMPLRLSGKKRRWDQKHSSLDGNPPGSRRHAEGANHVQISLTQFLMETLQALQDASVKRIPIQLWPYHLLWLLSLPDSSHTGPSKQNSFFMTSELPQVLLHTLERGTHLQGIYISAL